MNFRKKFFLTLCVFVGGTTLAFVSGAALGEYTAFATLVLSVFGASDLVDKKVKNQNGEHS